MNEKTTLLLVNLAILGFFGFIVFFKGYSGWWMLFPIVFRFRSDNNKD